VVKFSSILQLKKEHKEAEEELIFLGFTAGTQAYALGVFAVREILRVPRIYSLPRVPAFVKGVIDLRGAILPVIDFKERLDLGSVDPQKGRVVVVVIGSTSVGFLVDTVEEVFRSAPDQIKPPPKMFDKPHLQFIDGMVRFGDRLYLLLNPPDLLTPQEVDTLETQSWSPKK
jgi:purine-binding chemotaxis protein CheW